MSPNRHSTAGSYIPRLLRGVPAKRSRYSVELRGPSVEFPPRDPATAWSCTAPAWSSRQQIPLQRGAGRLQRGVPAGRSRSSVELGGSSVEFPPQIPLQRGAGRLQRGVPASRPRSSVELGGSSVEFPPADPAPAWSWAAPAWSSRRQTPLQRGAGRLQRGVPASRPRSSVELGGSSVEFPPADPAPAFQRGAGRLQRGVPASRSRSSVELGGSSVEFPPADPGAWGGSSVEFPPADPATAWSWAAPAWSSGQQIPLQRGAARLQRGVPPGRRRSSVEFRGKSAGFGGGGRCRI